MSGYVLGGYGITILTLGAYAAWVAARFRAIRKRPEAESRGS